MTDNVEAIQKEILRCKEEFVQSFGEILDHNFDAKTFEVFDPSIDSIHRNLRPKISLVGFSGVGKTTSTQLIKAEEIPMKHVPTITGDIATIKIGKLHFNLWDFAGQEQFSYLWNNFIKGSDAVLLITDSTLENVEKSRFFLELVKDEAPEAHTAVIGNKQDLPDALKSDQIEKIMGLKTYSMIAVDPQNRTKMIQIIADILEMSTEISPLLRPLLRRDELTQEAMTALETGEFSKALLLFNKISDLCIELGDDSLGREFYDKGEQIKELMKENAAPKVSEPTTPLPTEPQISEEIEEPEITEPITSTPPEPQIYDEVEDIKEPEMIEPPTPPETLETPELIEQIEEGERVEEEETFVDKKEAKRLKKERAKAAKKAKKLKKGKYVSEEVSPELTSIISKPSFMRDSEEPKTDSIPFQQPTSPQVTAPTREKKPDSSWMPQKLRDLKEKEPPKFLSSAMKKEVAKEDAVIKPAAIKDKKFDIKDFVIKQKPKTVTSVPKDAKAKLKTSAFGHVTNLEVAKEKLIPPKPKPITPAPIAPTRLVKPTIPKTTTTLKKEEVKEPPKVKEKPAEIEEMQIPEGANKKELEKLIMELKVKKTKIQEMSIDYDMKEFSGEITSEELNEKKLKLILMEKKIDKQIQKAIAMISE